MNPMLPPSAEASGVFALLEVISDPKKAKAQLDVIAQKQAELKAMQDSLQHTKAEMNDLKAQLDRQDDNLARREGSVAQREALAARDAQDVRRQFEEWQAGNAAMSRTLKDLDEKQNQVLARENALAAREAAMQRREDEAKSHEAWLAEAQERLNDRLTKLRALAG